VQNKEILAQQRHESINDPAASHEVKLLRLLCFFIVFCIILKNENPKQRYNGAASTW